MTNADYYRELAEDCLFAARQTAVRDVKEACLRDAAHFRALATEIERELSPNVGDGRDQAAAV
jgi:hypothetical protein